MEIRKVEEEAEEPPRPMTAGDFLNAASGIWADRDDIGDSVEYARKLRRHIEENLRGPTKPFVP